MKTPWYLSRARLRKEAGFEAISALLAPRETGAATRSGHHLVWSLFPADADAKRDFLWHQQARDTYLVLSAREPQDNHALFEVETKPFSPALAAGNRLAFMLRANPTVTIKDKSGARRHADVVMHAITRQRREDGGRATRDMRDQALQTSGAAGQWLARQGKKSGFVLDTENLVIDGYRRVVIPRTGQSDAGNGRGAVTFHSIDYQGQCTVQDPALFLERVCHGFGRAKSFGCGLMLLRRARGL